jgi:ubiquitin-protein ligase E3 C
VLSKPQGHTGLVILSYLLDHGFYYSLETAIKSIVSFIGTYQAVPTLIVLQPVDQKCPSLSPLIELAVAPFSLYPSDSATYTSSLSSFFTHVMTIPLLQYRLPLPSITHLSARLPLHNLHLVPSLGPQVSGNGTTLEQRYNLLGLLDQITSPRYTTLSADALDAYMSLMTSLIISMPINGFNPASNAKQRVAEQDQGVVDVVSSFPSNPSPATQPIPKLDPRTLKRLQIILTPAHHSRLLEISHRHARNAGLCGKGKARFDISISLSAFVLALVSVCPGERDEILRTICIEPDLLRELYHLYVSRSPVGKDIPLGSGPDQKDVVLDPRNSDVWVPLLMLCEMYSQVLDTMDDDEFFRTAGTTNGQDSGRNPLTTDELIEFTRQLLNIAFALFMRGDGETASTPSPQLRVGWEGMRDEITRCLRSIYARE